MMPKDGERAEQGKPTHVSLRGKPRVLRLKDGRTVVIRKVPRGVEVEGLDVEGFGAQCDKALTPPGSLP